jgi:hypothetical protein
MDVIYDTETNLSTLLFSSSSLINHSIGEWKTKTDNTHLIIISQISNYQIRNLSNSSAFKDPKLVSSAYKF